MWSLNAQMNRREFRSLMMLFLFVHFFPSAWRMFQKIRREEEERYQITRRHGGTWRHATTVNQWLEEHRDRIKRWVEHILNHAENSKNAHKHDTIQMCMHMLRHICIHVIKDWFWNVCMEKTRLEHVFKRHFDLKKHINTQHWKIISG